MPPNNKLWLDIRYKNISEDFGPVSKLEKSKGSWAIYSACASLTHVLR